VRLLSGLVIVCLIVTACSSGGDKVVDTAGRAVRRLKVEVVHRYPHDTSSFTEGLVMTDDGRLFESSGQYGSSDVRQVDLASGRVIRRSPLEDRYFGEGLAESVSGDLVQLTWREGTAFVWRTDDLSAAGRFSYSGEGWGLTRDGGELLQSDGSDRLTRRDPRTFTASGQVRVTEDGTPVDQLNELEAVGSVVYANVWKTTDIVAIDPSTGHVTATIDASSLVPDGLHDPDAVLNGIAHRPGSPPDRLLVTGKKWPVLYDVRLVPA
jgi:glutamine cyclotransferase